MARYLLGRVLWFGPTLVLISLVAFGLRQLAPGDPVEALNRSGRGELTVSPAAAERAYYEKAHQLNLDRPWFYFSIQPWAYPDTLYRILRRNQRQAQVALLRQSGNWPALQKAQRALIQLRAALAGPSSGVPATLRVEAQRAIQDLVLTTELPLFRRRAKLLARKLSVFPAPFAALARALDQGSAALLNAPRRWQLYLPELVWHGTNNQYHRWASGCWRGDFGVSYVDGRPVGAKLFAALRWTLRLNLAATLLAYALAIPLGVFAAVYQNRWPDRVINWLLFAAFALPSFWAAILLLTLFTDPHLGWNFLRVTGIGEYPAEASWWEVLQLQFQQLVLPVFCLTYGALAYIARQMRGSMIQALQQDYVRTARAKGLPETVVRWKHAWRNALFPQITLLGSIFPALLTGSVLVESVFNLPGMGRLAVEAINQHDWPVVYAILLLAALLTMIGLLFADLAYAWADPRVRYQNPSQP